MVRIILMLTVLIGAQCSRSSKQPLLIKINQSADNCFDYFVISPELEPNSNYAKRLGAYLYHSLVDVYECRFDTTLTEEIFNRASFEKSVYLFFLDSSYLKLNHYETTSRWTEGYSNLISNCSDTLVAYRVVDSLLFYHREDALIGLWKGAYLERLSNYRKYIDWCLQSDNIDGAIECVVILHNIGDLENRDLLISKLARNSTFRKYENILMALLEHDSFITYEAFAEALHGGV